jgi:hypothetical protein
MSAGHAVAQNLDDGRAGADAEMGREEGVEVALAGVVARMGNHHAVEILARQSRHRHRGQHHVDGELMLQRGIHARCGALVHADRYRPPAQDRCTPHQAARWR